jgi:hypothetical protein
MEDVSVDVRYTGMTDRFEVGFDLSHRVDEAYLRGADGLHRSLDAVFEKIVPAEPEGLGAADELGGVDAERPSHSAGDDDEVARPTALRKAISLLMYSTARCLAYGLLLDRSFSCENNPHIPETLIPFFASASLTSLSESPASSV